VISGAHAIIYTEDADALRTFLRDTLGLSSVDAGDGWLIFGLPPAEVAAHPAGQDQGAGRKAGGRHELYLLCDDIEATMAELGGRGVEFAQPVTDQGWGLLTKIRLPGGGELGLYEPRHPRPAQTAGAAGA
jgi:catechol 2,3-dioxygenase-like lactoylglutathione lyase family enzyme